MNQKHTLDELNNLSREELITMVLMMQGQLDTLNDNIEKLIEQVRLANSYRFGKHSEKLSVIEGQMSFFDEADAMHDNSAAEPESWTVELHTVEVYVSTDGDHQDEFLRGKRPKDLLRNSIVTPSLLASILNVKYVNSSALNRVAQEFERNGVNISKQTMSN